MHEVLVNRLVNLAQERVWLGELTIAFDLGVKSQMKQKRWEQREENKKTTDSIKKPTTV